MGKIVYKRGIIVEEDVQVAGTIMIDRNRMGKIGEFHTIMKFDEKELLIERRARDEFVDCALWLDSKKDWILCEDSNNAVCLIPLHKEDK